MYLFLFFSFFSFFNSLHAMEGAAIVKTRSSDAALARETRHKQPREKTVLEPRAKAAYETIARAAIESKNKAELERVLGQLNDEDKVSQIKNEPKFFSDLFNKVQTVLWSLPSEPLIDGPKERAQQHREAAEKRLQGQLNNTQFLAETGEGMQPADPMAPAVAKGLEKKLDATQAAIAAQQKKRADALTAAREAARELEALEKKETQLEGAYLHVGAVNDEAVNAQKVAGIKEKKEHAKPVSEKKRWGYCSIS